MLEIPSDLSTFLPWMGGLAAGVVLLAGLGMKRRILGLLGLLLVAVAAVFAAKPEPFSLAVMMVRQGPDGLSREERVLHSAAEYVFADGTRMAIPKPSMPLSTFLINDSPVALQVVPVVYGVPAPADEILAVVSPRGSWSVKGRIDYFGGGKDAPPREIRSVGAVELRYWIRWDEGEARRSQGQAR